MNKIPPRDTEGSVSIVIGRHPVPDTEPQFRIQSNDFRVLVLGLGVVPSTKGLVEYCKQLEINVVPAEHQLPQKNNWFREMEPGKKRSRFNR